MSFISLSFVLVALCQCQNLRGLDDTSLEHHPHHHCDKDPLCKVADKIHDWCQSQPDLVDNVNACWYRIATLRTMPNAVVAGQEIGRKQYPFPSMKISPPPEVTEVIDGHDWAEVRSLHGNHINNNIMDYYQQGLWVTPPSEFNKLFVTRLANMDFSGKDVDSVNKEVFGSMVAAAGMSLTKDGDDIFSPDGEFIYILKVKLTSADADLSWDPTKTLSIDEIPAAGKGVYRPCAKSYDLNQTVCEIDMSSASGTDWPTEHIWERKWMNDSWSPNSLPKDQYPFTGQGWTFDWFGYKDYIQGGCKASRAEYKDMIFGESEMVISYSTEAQKIERLSPIKYACRYCEGLSSGSADQKFECPQNFMDFVQGKC